MGKSSGSSGLKKKAKLHKAASRLTKYSRDAMTGARRLKTQRIRLKRAMDKAKGDASATLAVHLVRLRRRSPALQTRTAPRGTL